MSLHLADGLDLPLDYVTKVAAIIAQRRKGKTYTASVVAEELVRLGLPWVALDPTGAWWGLRAGADGGGDGLPVIIIGGKHGDVPLEEGAGKFIAELVVDHPGWYVLDLSLIDTRAGERRFATDFGEALIRRKRQPGKDFPMHLFVDEADMFAPQEKDRGEQRMLGAFQAIVRRGGLAGLGCTLITQRPALLNKSVLTQLDILVLLRLVAGQDQDAVDKNYIQRAAGKEQRAELMDSLSSLGMGEAWVWEPGAVPPIFERVQIRERHTFNSSATPTPGEQRVEPKGLADIDLDAVTAAMAEAIERVKADDPVELRKEIARLKRELAQRAPERVEVEVPVEVQVEVEVPVVPDGLLDEIQNLEGFLRAAAAEFATQASKAVTAVIDAAKATPDRPSRSTRGTPPPKGKSPAVAHRPPVVAPARAPSLDADHDAVNPPRQKILNAIAWYNSVGVTPASRSHVALVAGTSPNSSGYEKNLSGLRTAGFITYPKGGYLALTPAGEAIATVEVEVSTVEDLIPVLAAKLGRPKGRILELVAKHYPDPISREDLADEIPVSVNSSGYEKNLSGLRSLGFIDYPERGYVVATEALMIDR